MSHAVHISTSETCQTTSRIQWSQRKLHTSSKLYLIMVILIFTQHAGLTLQQGQDVFVKEQGAEAEEIPQSQVDHGAPIPHPWLCLDHCSLCDCDLQHLLPRHALAAGQHHSLLAGAERWQETPQRVPGRVSVGWHRACCLMGGEGPPPKGPDRWMMREVRGWGRRGGRWVLNVSPSSDWPSNWSVFEC